MLFHRSYASDRRRIIYLMMAAVLFTAGTRGLAVSFRERLIKLSSREIGNHIVGRTLTPDRNYRQRAEALGETFEAGGVWKSSRQWRALLMLRGTWTIRGDKICIRIAWANYGDYANEKQQCREVWLEPRTKQIAMFGLDVGHPSLKAPFLWFSRAIGAPLSQSQLNGRYDQVLDWQNVDQ